MDIFTGKDRWETIEDFPYVHSYIYDYSMVTFQNQLYLFGGYGDDSDGGKPLDLAVTFTGPPYKWTIIGTLLTARYSHGSIVNGGSIMHIGGKYNEK